MNAIREMTTRNVPALLLALLLAGLSGCDKLGLDNSAADAAREEAEGKAIGSACRQSARPLEECYQTNRRASKAAIFAGWREMDAYMRENKIEELKPEGAKPAEKAAAEDASAKVPVAVPKEEKNPPKPTEASGKPSRPLAAH